MKGQITGKALKLNKEQARAFANAMSGFDKKDSKANKSAKNKGSGKKK